MTETTESVTDAPRSPRSLDLRLKVPGEVAAKMGLWQGAMVETAMGQWIILESYQINLVEDSRMIVMRVVV